MTAERSGPGVLALDDPVLLVDDDGLLVDWNGSAVDVFPDGFEFAPGATVVDLFEGTGGDRLTECLPVGAEDAPETVAVTFAKTQRGTPERYDLRVHAGEGEHPVVVREATRSRRPGPGLERLATVLDALPVPVYVLDADGRFQYVNHALAEMLDIPRDRFFEPDAHAGMGMSPADMQRARSLILDLLADDPETGDATAWEMTTYTRNGEEIPCENQMALVLEDGEFWATVGTIHDVTVQRRREQRLGVLERVLRHNLRTEVSVVDGYLDVIDATVDDPAVEDAVSAIRDATGELVGLSAKTRTVGEAIVRGDDDLSTVPVATPVADAVDAVRESHPEATVEVDLDESRLVTAGASLETAFVELLENAVVHTDGDPWVAVSTRTTGPRTELEFEVHHDQVVVVVEDDGPGIPEQDRAVVGGDGTESPLQHSDGLGLWTASWIVHEYGGQLRIRDREPRGTCVEVFLPSGDPPMDDERD